MARQIQGSQRDFSFGEIDIDLKRADDHPARKAGLRQMVNTRIRNSGAVQNRSGRRALYQNANACNRIEEFTISTSNTFKIGFGTARCEIRDSAGVVVGAFIAQGGGAALPWTNFNNDQVVYAVSPTDLTITVTFPGMRPQVIIWDGAASWTMIDYLEQVISGQKRTLFYRLSPQGITIQPGARTGAGVTVVASANVFSAAWIGARIRYIGRQMLVVGYTNPQSINVDIKEPLPGSQILTFGSDPSLAFVVGDVVIGSSTNAKGVVTAFGGANTMTVQLLSVQVVSPNVATTGGFLGRALGLGSQGTGESSLSFVLADTVVGPGGSIALTAVGGIGTPQAVAIWDDEVMNTLRGYPAACFVDQYRTGFNNFPALPSAIAWSAINASTDLYVGANPANAMFETVPGKQQVYYVVPGPESSEFIFCDHGIFYVKIDPSNPLKPGGVYFQKLSSDGSAQVQPRLSQELILYVNAGRSDMMAVVASGAYYRPFNTKNLSDLHSHLFSSIRAIAVPTADGTFSERYAYVLNADGTLTVGKYNLDEVIGSGISKIGWGPWTGEGAIQWVAAWNADVIFTSLHQNVGICEILDDTQYLDCALPVNALPAAFTPSPGQGPLALFANKTVTLIDQVTRVMGDYLVNADGFIVPQGNAGENLLAASLVAGFSWTMTVEPFAPDATSGADMGQRMKMRTIAQFAAYVINSTGFIIASLFSSKQTRTSPALGTVMKQNRIEMWNQDDDPTLPPKQRETVELWGPPGSSYDPRVAIIKDTPGPLLIAEIGMEISL